MRIILGFHIPTTVKHWAYLLACVFIGAAAGEVQGGKNWHEAVLAGIVAGAGFLKTNPLPAATVKDGAK